MKAEGRTLQLERSLKVDPVSVQGQEIWAAVDCGAVVGKGEGRVLAGHAPSGA